jgi:hypothetical protein
MTWARSRAAYDGIAMSILFYRLSPGRPCPVGRALSHAGAPPLDRQDLYDGFDLLEHVLMEVMLNKPKRDKAQGHSPRSPVGLKCARGGRSLLEEVLRWEHSSTVPREPSLGGRARVANVLGVHVVVWRHPRRPDEEETFNDEDGHIWRRRGANEPNTACSSAGIPVEVETMPPVCSHCATSFFGFGGNGEGDDRGNVARLQGMLELRIAKGDQTVHLLPAWLRAIRGTLEGLA